jgi:hypothetical protein
MQDESRRSSRDAQGRISAAFIGEGLDGVRVAEHPISSRRSGYRLTGEKWRCCCPVCGDVLTVEDVGVGKVMVNCAGPCGADVVVLKLAQLGRWPSGLRPEEPRPMQPRKPSPAKEVRGIVDKTSGPFVRLRLAALNSVAVDRLTPLGAWVLIRLLREHARPRRNPEEPFLLPLDQMRERLRKRKAALVEAVREVEALKLAKIVHGVFDRAMGRCQSNLYRLTFVGPQCSDEWRELEPPETETRGCDDAVTKLSPRVPTAELGPGSHVGTTNKTPAGGIRDSVAQFDDDARLSVTPAELSALRTLSLGGATLLPGEVAALPELRSLALLEDDGAGRFRLTELGWGVLRSAVDGEDGDEAARDET